MSDLIERWAVIELLSDRRCNTNCFDEQGQKIYEELSKAIENVKDLPSAQPEIIRCKDCKNQEKFFHKDGRRKDGGYYIYGCSLAEGYSHVCLDDDYCSRAERRTDE